MSCFIEEGLTLGCRDASIGGIKAVYVLGGSGATTPSITDIAYDAQDQISGVTGTGVFYKFELVKGSSSMEETISVNATSNTIVYTPSLTLNLPKLDNTLRKIWYELTKQSEFFAIVVDNNGRYWFPGEVNGLTITDGSIFTGASFTDANGSTMTATGGEPASVRELDLGGGNVDSIFTGITFDVV